MHSVSIFTRYSLALSSLDVSVLAYLSVQFVAISPIKIIKPFFVVTNFVDFAS